MRDRKYIPLIEVYKMFIDFRGTTRAINLLLNQGFKNLGDVVEHSERELMKIHGFGKVSLEATKHFLTYHGLELKEG